MRIVDPVVDLTVNQYLTFFAFLAALVSIARCVTIERETAFSLLVSYSFPHTRPTAFCLDLLCELCGLSESRRCVTNERETALMVSGTILEYSFSILLGRNSEMEDHNLTARIIVDTAYHIHTKIGPGLLETVYERILAYELQKRDLSVEHQRAIPIQYESISFDVGFRADLVVDDKIIVELKSIERLDSVHKKQLLTYLKLSDMRLGLLINFGENLIKNGIHRIVNGL